MKRVLSEPLLHFLVLGALLFVGYGLTHRDDAPEAGHIVVTQGKIASLRASFTRVRQRPPSPSELEGLLQDSIREEVLAREAIALGLDRDDTVIRRRLRQKMEFVANDLAAPAEPSEAELEEFLAQHPDLFRVEPRFTFRQVFLHPDRRGSALQHDAARLLATLQQAGAQADFAELGDVTLLSSELTDVPASEVTRQFGEAFTRELAQVPEGQWHGPVISSYGMHLVYVQDRTPGRIPELPEVREQVARAWADARRREHNEQFYRNLLQRYTITIEQPQPAASTNILTVYGQ
jgi:hypothetical protein